jgi:hypothetical protein
MCILDSDLAYYNGPEDFACQEGFQCGRYPQKHGTLADTGQYKSDFVAAMWEAYYNKSAVLPGNINGDGTVNIFDYNIFLQNLGATNDCQNEADLNADCSVNIFDYNILLENFGRSM